MSTQPLAGAPRHAPALRAWQLRALADYRERQPRDYLAVATPGAGKTTFALTLAAELLAQGVIQQITVVAPTEHLKVQWARAAALAGIDLDPRFSNAQGSTSREYDGVVVTYAQVAQHPMLHRARTDARRTLVVLDEIHHAGDAMSWGEATREAFEPAARRLALTGTPFRSDTNPIPFVRYSPAEDGVLRSAADHSYGYGDALRDQVVRPVLFLAYSGQLRWRTSAGHELEATLGEPLTAEQNAHAWRTALDPAGEWIGHVLAAADTRLSQVRAGGMPDAGGLVIATDHAAARAYALLLKRKTGVEPVLVLSDDPAASRKIAEFAKGDDRWMVAVRMVSEGVDVPRLAVGVYATTTATPLFFAQAVGRFVRARRRGETASVFLPSVPALLGHASELEVERDHVLGRPVNDEGDIFAAEQDLLDAANAGEGASDELLGSWEALGSQATFDRVLYDGGEFGHSGEVHVGSDEEMDFLGIPGLLEPDQVRDLLHSRQSERAQKQKSKASPADSVAEVSTHEQLAVLRRELNGLVAAWFHRTGQPHGATHSQLRKECGGPAAAVATADQLRARIEALRDKAARKSS
jgi:superfamily II DNA or RNA helicase